MTWVKRIIKALCIFVTVVRHASAEEAHEKITAILGIRG